MVLCNKKCWGDCKNILLGIHIGHSSLSPQQEAYRSFFEGIGRGKNVPNSWKPTHLSERELFSPYIFKSEFPSTRPLTAAIFPYTREWPEGYSRNVCTFSIKNSTEPCHRKTVPLTIISLDSSNIRSEASPQNTANLAYPLLEKALGW